MLSVGYLEINRFGEQKGGQTVVRRLDSGWLQKKKEKGVPEGNNKVGSSSSRRIKNGDLLSTQASYKSSREGQKLEFHVYLFAKATGRSDVKEDGALFGQPTPS